MLEFIIAVGILGFICYIIYVIFQFLNSIVAPAKDNNRYRNKSLLSYKELLTQFKDLNNENLIPDEMYDKIKDDLLNNQNNLEIITLYNDKYYKINSHGRLDKIREYRKLLLEGVITKEDYLKKRNQEIAKVYVIDYELHFFKGEPIKITLEEDDGWEAVYNYLDAKGIKNYKKNIDYIYRVADSAKIFQNENLGTIKRYIAING